MARMIISLILMLSFFSLNYAQIEIILDNDQPNFTVVGSWFTKTHSDCYNGTARYIKKGKGDYYVEWNQTLNFPGKYKVEMYLINYKYAKDAHVHLKTLQGDTLILVDQYNEPLGWKDIGIFTLPSDFKVRVTDLFADSGTYVYADAFKLTYAGQVFKIGGKVTTGLFDTTTIVKVSLLTKDTSTILLEKELSPTDRNFLFENIPADVYVLQFKAWGYETLVVGNIDIRNNDQLNLSFSLQPAVGNRYTITGRIFLDDSSNTQCKVELIYRQNNQKVGHIFAGHKQSFVFQNILEGEYKLKITAPGYLPDTTSVPQINLNKNIDLGTILMYAFFQFAWYTDIHIGAGTETGFQKVIDGINLRKDQLDFAFATGDLTEKGLTSEFNTYKSYIGTIKIPVYNIPGNHDTKWSESGQQAYKTIIGPYCFSFNHKGFHFIGFNSGNYMKGGYGYFDPANILWLEQDLKNLPDPNMPIIFATHYPLDIDNIPNYWRVLDLLKNYNTVFILVGHGHSNRKYDFEGIPGAMSMDTYNTSNPSGFNIVTVSKKEITVTSVLNSTGAETIWLRQPFIETRQPQIEFKNLTLGETISTPKTIEIVTNTPMTSGTYLIRPEMSSPSSLTGSGSQWTVTINPGQNFDNGSHTLTINLKDASGKTYTRTTMFYIENGLYPKSKWRFNSNATIICSPVHDSTGVYFGTSEGKVYGISLSNGSLLWTPYQTGGMVLSTGCVKDTILYIGSSDGYLYAISTKSGNLCWSYSAGGAIVAPVIVQDSLLYFAGSRKLICYNLNKKSKTWEYQTGGLIESKPAIIDNKIIFTSWDCYVYCLNRFDGSVIWRFNRLTNFYYAPAACWPVVGIDKVFIVDPQRYLTAITLSSGQKVWESNSPECWESIGISTDKTRVYVRSLDGNLYAFSATANNQQLVWSCNANYGWDSTPSMPIEKNGAVFTGGKKGFVISVEGINGRLKWRYWASQDLVGTVTPLDGVRVLAAALDGTVTLIENDPQSKINGDINLPFKNDLLPPYPNPFNSSTRITFTLKDKQNVKVEIYNLVGQCVKTWQYTDLQPGEYTLVWNGKNSLEELMSSGLYIIKIAGENFTKSQRVLFLK